MRQVRGDGEDAVVVGRIDAARPGCPAPSRTPRACRPRRRRCRAAASGCSSGPRTGRRSAASGPEFSVPATGWAGTKCTPAGMCGSMSAITACFTEPTSETMQPGLSAGRDRRGRPRRRRRPACRRSPGRRPCTAAARSVPQWSTSFSRLAVAAVSALRVAATIGWRGRACARRARSSRRSGRCRSGRSCRTSARSGVICLRRRSGCSEAAHGLHLGLGADGDAQMLGQAVARDHARDQPVVHQPVVGGGRALLRAEADRQEVADAGQRLQAELARSRREPGQPDVVVGAAGIGVGDVLQRRDAGDLRRAG